VRGVVVQVAVEDGGEFGDVHFIAGFLAGFTRGGSGRRFTYIGPASWERPAAILEFTDEKDAAVFERGDANINFGSGVTGLLGEEIHQGVGTRKSRAGGHHFRGNFTDFAVALRIELVLTVGETGLGDGLEATRPSEPLRDGHASILAAKAGSNK